MKPTNHLSIPTKEDQRLAMESYDPLVSTLRRMETTQPEIVIAETEERIRVPLHALKLLSTILKTTSEGKPVTVVPVATEMTTQAAANLLGCSRPHLIKLLEEGTIPFTKIGRHRRVRYEDVMRFRAEHKREQRELLTKIMEADENDGLYDS